MKVKRTFIKMAHQAARAYYSEDTTVDVSDLRWRTVQNQIRKNLILIRKIYGLNQRQCADLLGLNPKYMNAVEKGRYYPSLHCIWIFSQTFCIPIKLLIDHVWSEEEISLWKTSLEKTEIRKKSLAELYENVR